MTARPSTSLWLLTAFLRHGGRTRALMVTTCTAVVSGLLLVAVTVLQLEWSGEQREVLANTVTDPGVRGGYVFGLVLICLAPLTLLRQVVRLGSAEREQRLAGLRLAGATPADVRRLGALEVGIPATAGGLAGIVVFLGLRAVFGGRVISATDPGFGEGQIARELRLVPVSVAPEWWQVLLVVAAVGALGGLAGGAALRGVVVSPVGVSRRTPRGAPRPWGVLLMLLAVAVLASGYEPRSSGIGLAFLVTFIGLLVAGIMWSSPWVAYRVGRYVEARASTPAVLVAARRLVADPRPAGRAAAAIGTIGLVAGGGGALVSDLPSSSGGEGFSEVDAFYTVPIALAGGVLLVALAMVVFSLTVHGVESLVDRRRAIASLAALGTSHEELLRMQRWEVGLVAVPVAAIGVLVGSVPFVALLNGPWDYVWVPLLVDLLTVGLAWVAVLASTSLTRRHLRAVSAPTSLRTP